MATSPRPLERLALRALTAADAACNRLYGWRDDSLFATALVRGGGMRHDRQLYVLRKLPLPSGPTTMDVHLARLDSGSAPRTDDAGERDDDSDSAGHDRGGEQRERREEGREDEQRRRRMADEVPASLHLRETLTLQPREVLLVTDDQSARRLRMVRGAP